MHVELNTYIDIQIGLKIVGLNHMHKYTSTYIHTYACMIPTYKYKCTHMYVCTFLFKDENK